LVAHLFSFPDQGKAFRNNSDTLLVVSAFVVFALRFILWKALRSLNVKERMFVSHYSSFAWCYFDERLLFFDVGGVFKEIEFEMARTQKNKATEYHLGRLK
jgi:hypothetical protein